MSKERKNPKTRSQDLNREIVRDKKTGLLFLTGPKITKKKVAKDFPVDSDRDTIVIRRSVRL